MRVPYEILKTPAFLNGARVLKAKTWAKCQEYPGMTFAGSWQVCKRHLLLPSNALLEPSNMATYGFAMKEIFNLSLMMHVFLVRHTMS